MIVLRQEIRSAWSGRTLSISGGGIEAATRTGWWQVECHHRWADGYFGVVLSIRILGPLEVERDESPVAIRGRMTPRP